MACMHASRRRCFQRKVEVEVEVVLSRSARRARHRDRCVSRQLWNSVPCEKWRRDNKDGTRAVGRRPPAVFFFSPLRAKLPMQRGTGQGPRTAAPNRSALELGVAPVVRLSAAARRPEITEMGVGIVRRPTGLQEHACIPLYVQ